MKKPTNTPGVVYRVVEVDLPFEGAHIWKVATFDVVRMSPKQIKLKRLLNGGTVFKPDALGRLFFETPLQALQHFLTARRLEIESFNRRLKEAARAVSWALSQEGMLPALGHTHDDDH